MNKESYFTSQEILELCKDLNIEVKNEKTGESGLVSTFIVNVKEERTTSIEINAINVDDAIDTVMEMYRNGELESEDFYKKVSLRGRKKGV